MFRAASGLHSLPKLGAKVEHCLICALPGESGTERPTNRYYFASILSSFMLLFFVFLIHYLAFLCLSCELHVEYTKSCGFFPYFIKWLLKHRLRIYSSDYFAITMLINFQGFSAIANFMLATGWYKFSFYIQMRGLLLTAISSSLWSLSPVHCLSPFHNGVAALLAVAWGPAPRRQIHYWFLLINSP